MYKSHEVLIGVYFNNRLWNIIKKGLFSWWNDGGSVNDRKERNDYIKKTKHNIRINKILFSNECKKLIITGYMKRW